MDSPGDEDEAGECGRVGEMHIALRRHGHDSAHGGIAGTRGRERRVIAETGTSVETDKQPDSVDSLATEARNLQSPLGCGV